MNPELHLLLAHDGRVEDKSLGDWHLAIGAGAAGQYRLAQIDDYHHLPRPAFRWRSPLTLELRARVSAPEIPGTWGFGFWNDPFAATFGARGTARRLPALPNAAWFFFASPPNYLALHDDHPAQGMLAGTFGSLPIPPLFLSVGLLFAPLLAWRPTARLLRKIARLPIREAAVALDIDVVAWHTYRIDWQPQRVEFAIDGATCFKTRVSPRGPLGLVIWIDNQFAAFGPDGRLRFGTLANPEPAWMEIERLDMR